MPEHQDQPYWRGINHLALITNDMDATVRFYHGVLGARLVATIGTEGFRHYFFELGAQCTLAFFEYRDQPIERFAKPAGVPDPRAIQFDHLSLNLPDEQALESLRARLNPVKLYGPPVPPLHSCPSGMKPAIRPPPSERSTANQL